MARVRGGAAGEAQDRGGDARAARSQGGILRASVVVAFAHLDVVTADVRVQFEHLRHDGSAGAVQALMDRDWSYRVHLDWFLEHCYLAHLV